MKINLADNIRRLRKENSLTQEQLAEALGVTVGAVSKWELGASVPELSMLIDIARYFEISIDMLLDYELHSNSLTGAVEEIKALRNAKAYDKGQKTAEQYLKKYRNSFEVTYYSGELYSMIALERHDEMAAERCLQLFFRSLELRKHEPDCEISEASIRKRIAEAYFSLGEHEKAVELLKKHNDEGINNDLIGFTLATVARDPEAALPYLSDAFGDYLSGLCRVCVGYANAYSLRKEYDLAIEILLWWTTALNGLKPEGRVSLFDKYGAVVTAGCAAFAAAKGDEDVARKYLQEAIQIAKTFDAAPNYSMQGVKFNTGNETGVMYDSMGETAMDGIYHDIENAGEPERQVLRKLWEELVHE